jgi:hypothetical protein
MDMNINGVHALFRESNEMKMVRIQFNEKGENCNIFALEPDMVSSRLMFRQNMSINLGNEPSISEIFNSLEVDDILRMNASTFDLADMWRLARIIL